MLIVVVLKVVVQNVMLNVVAPVTMLGTNDILHKRRAAFFVVLCVAFLNVMLNAIILRVTALSWCLLWQKQVIFVGFIQLPKKTTTGFTKTRIQPVWRQNLIPLLSIQSSLSQSLFWLWLENVFDANEKL